LNKAVSYINSNQEETVEFVMQNFQLPPILAKKSLEHTKYKMAQEAAGKNIEQKIGKWMQKKGYIDALPAQQQIYY
jgi:hypothetical protein